MKRFRLYILMYVWACTWVCANAQRVAVKTNMLYDVVGIASLGGELKTSKHSSVNLMMSYNPLKYTGAKWKNFSFQPEYRHWFHRAFTGPFISANMAYGGFNIDKMHIGGLYGKHREGHFLGAGVGGGYHLILGERFSLEFTVAADFVHCRYHKYREGDLPYHEGKFQSNTVVPIGTGVSLAFML